MQHDAISNIAYHPSMDFTSFFLPQTDPYSHDLSALLDMAVVDPYISCNGSSITMIPVTEDEANAQPMNHGNDERKKRRLVSNRESARRSRVRKQRRLDELSSQVSELRDTNQRLLVELNHMISKHARIVRENSQLREEASDLQRKLSEMEMEDAEVAAAAAAAAPRTLEVA
ncbi:basic leucine zipper 43-like [Oryza glaberrima]|nr:basic leucine zipper 43-like [Oryza glaberrima]